MQENEKVYKENTLDNLRSGGLFGYSYVDHQSNKLNKYDMSQIDLNEEEQAQYTAYMSSGANANLMDKVVKPMFRVQDYGLWSIGMLKGKSVTLGMFNKVMIIDEEQIPRALKERTVTGAEEADNAATNDESAQGTE